MCGEIYQKIKTMRRCVSFFLLAACFVCCTPVGEPDKPVDPVITELPDPVLDVRFLADGTADDVSGNNIAVTTVPGASLVTYYNTDAKRTVARFWGEPGSEAPEGYYKIDYYYDKLLREALKEGHSLECQFMLQESGAAGKEMKIFSSTDEGGTGIMLSDASHGGDISFLLNLSSMGKSSWIRTGSKIVPVVGKYYHVVGVWDAKAQSASIYVNGELCGESRAEGALNMPANTRSRWFCIGGDASPMLAQSAFSGEVVLSRVYGDALDATQVNNLWKAADADFKHHELSISNVLMLPVAAVNVSGGGSRFTLCADGLRNADAIRLYSASGEYSKLCNSLFKTGKLTAELPSDLVSGTYKVFVVRGEAETPAGSVEFMVGEHETAVNAPKIVAHRGFHSSSVPENSIAALAAAQKSGFDASETDVWITADGKLYINHDGVISGKKIQDCTSAELQGVKLSNGEKLPTLEEYLEQLSKSESTKLVIEFKEHSSAMRNDALVEAVLETVAEAGMDSMVEYISAGREICRKVAREKPDALVGYLSSTDDLESLAGEGIKSCDFSYSYMFQHKDLFERAHGLGMKVNIWTINTSYDMTKAIGLGADYITTDRPEHLSEIIERLFD